MGNQGVQISARKRKFLLIVWFLSWLGLGFSIELTRIDYEAVRNADFNPVCKISERVDCVAVALSPYSKILGISNSVYGIIGYGLLLLLIPFRLKSRIRIFAHLENYLFLLALFFVGISIYLAVVSAFILHTFCLWCTVLYLINLAFLVLIIFALDSPKTIFQEFKEDFQLLRTSPGVLVGFLAVILLVVILFIIQLNWAQAKKNARIKTLVNNRPVELEFTKDPSIGPADAPITIIEFSDFQCPFCRKTHQVLKELRREFGPRIRLIYKNFPLDSDCNPALNFRMHPNSCLAAYASECAYLNGCFEEFYEKLIHAQNYSPASILTMASECGIDPEKFRQCLNSSRVQQMVKKDIEDALRLGIKGTPMLVINGRPLLGYRDLDEMRLLIKALLQGKEIPGWK